MKKQEREKGRKSRRRILRSAKCLEICGFVVLQLSKSSFNVLRPINVLVLFSLNESPSLYEGSSIHACILHTCVVRCIYMYR